MRIFLKHSRLLSVKFLFLFLLDITTIFTNVAIIVLKITFEYLKNLTKRTKVLTEIDFNKYRMSFIMYYLV